MQSRMCAAPTGATMQMQLDRGLRKHALARSLEASTSSGPAHGPGSMQLAARLIRVKMPPKRGMPTCPTIPALQRQHTLMKCPNAMSVGSKATDPTA